MIPTAVARLAPLTLLAVFSCAGPQGGQEHSQPQLSAVSSETKSFQKSQTTAAPFTAVKPTPPKQTEAPSSLPKQGKVTRIMLGDLFALQQEGKALIYDVRPTFIYRLGHIPGAVNWPKADFNAQLVKNETVIADAKTNGKAVVLYCVDFACPDARTVSTWLSARGHSVAVLEGGWDAWKSGGLPTE